MIVYAPCPMGNTWTREIMERWLIGEWNYQCIARVARNCLQMMEESNTVKREATRVTHAAAAFRLERTP